MILEIGKYKIHIDVDKNKEFYKNAEWITDGCSCDGCNNYIFATKTFPKWKWIFIMCHGFWKKEIYIKMTETDKNLLG